MSDRKKELKEQYKETKPQMGVFVIKHCLSNTCYIEGSIDVVSSMNRSRFELKMDSHKNKNLQTAWNTLQKDDFIWEIVDSLSYSNDENYNGYKDDVAELAAAWKEKLHNEQQVKFF